MAHSPEALALAASLLDAVTSKKRTRRFRAPGVPYVLRLSGRRSWYAKMPDGRIVSMRTDCERTAEQKLATLMSRTFGAVAKRKIAKPKASRRMGFVYFVQAQSGPVKIGWTHDVAKRVDHIQTHNHEQVSLLGIVAGTSEGEAWIHRALSAHRIRGEWFAYTPEVKVFVANLLAERGRRDAVSATAEGVE